MNESQVISEIVWEPYSPGSFNPEFSGYTAGEYSTGAPHLGWCLYSRGGSCWEQRTKKILPPEPGAQPERVDGKWFWVRPIAAVRPRVKYIMIFQIADEYHLHIADDVTPGIRYRSVKPTLDEAVEALNDWMKGVVVW